MEGKVVHQCRPVDITVVGGGVAGATIATQLLRYANVRLTLVEHNRSLISGPPFCHLHAGGNLYREIDLTQCKRLMHESIETLRLYPNCANIRPTVIAVPERDRGDVDSLLPRLRELRAHYQHLVDTDPQNRVLGEPADYFKAVTKEQMEALALRQQPNQPNSIDDWLIPVAQQLDLDTIKWPLLVVQEYGLSMFRVAATAQQRLQRSDRCELRLGQSVVDIKANLNGWQVSFDDGSDSHADYVINACGYRSGELDDKLSLSVERLVEFKAAYLAKWSNQQYWPELVFHGERGTANGMAQFTPYADGVVQLHGMTKEITLFENGVAKSNANSSQPRLHAPLSEKLAQGWASSVATERTNNAINYLSYFLPNFANAQVIDKPMYGAQQVPGSDLSLRAAGVVFPQTGYARAEIVKANSALAAAKAIEQNLIEMSLLNPQQTASDFQPPQGQVIAEAIKLAKQRDYPEALAMPWPALPQAESIALA